MAALRGVVAGLAVALVAGCAAVTAEMKSMEGRHIDTVIAEWGYPSEVREVAGRTLYVWDQRGAVVMPSHSTGTVFLPGGGMATYDQFNTGGVVVPTHCTRILEVDATNTVSAWQWQGNDCF